MPHLTLEHLSKSYGEGAARLDVLRDVSLSIAEGEFLAILGFSGTGKTTLINLMAGLETPDAGMVRFKGRPVAGPGPERGLVFQSYSLMPWLSVAQNVALAVGPDHLGELVVAGSHATFVPLDGLRFTVDGKPGTGPVALIADSQGEPTVIGFAEGRASFMAVERGGRLALRVRDAKAVTRTGFKGIPRYPVDIGWRLEARFEAHPPGTTLPVASVINTVDEMANPGVVVFEKDGRTFRLEAVDEGDGRLFLVFGDRSNGRETYGAGRFLYAAPADANGRTIVDFNEAYNPPCAMNAFSTCPLPPPENRLELLVNAGELKYEGIGH